MEMDAHFTNPMIHNSNQLRSPVRQDYLWPVFAPHQTPLTALDVRSDPSFSTSGTSSPRPFSNQISPNDAGGQTPFQTALANATLHPSFIPAQPSLTTEGRPLTTSRSHNSIASEFTQQAIPRQRSFDFGRQGVQTQPLQSYSGTDRALVGTTCGVFQAPAPEQRQARLKRRWSPSLDSTQENHLETLWNTHGVEGSGHLGIFSSDISHDPHGPFPTLANDANAPFDIWGDTTSPLSMFALGQVGGFGEASGLAAPGAPQIGINVGHKGSPIEIDYPLGSGDLMMTTTGASLPRPANKQEDLSIGADGLGSRRSSSVEAGTTNGLKKATTRDTSPDLEHHDHDEGDPADGDDDPDDHHVKADPEKPNKPANNNFVNKLHTMISDPKAAGFIWWTELGTSFIVSSAGEFSREILGQHFKHSNFSSFVRQLNMYGFHKINRTPRNQRPQTDAQRWEFSHPKFLRGRTDLLEDIKRKAIEPDPNQTRQRVELPTEVAAQLRRMSQEHKEVVEALLTERRRVQKLVGVVKNLYEAIGHITGVPAFPLDLLDSPSPPAPSSPLLDDMLACLTHPNTHPMKLTGNTLVPAGHSSSSSSPTDPTSSPGHCRSSRTTRGTAIAVDIQKVIAVETQKVDADGHASKRSRLGVELAAPGEGPVRRTSTRSQTQPEGGGSSPPGATVHAKRRCHTAHHGHSAHPNGTTASLRYIG